MKRNLEEQKQGNSMNEAIPLFYTKEQYERALARSQKHPDRSTDPQSITRGHGLITGCLGEIIVEDYLEHIGQTDDDEAREVKEKLQYDILLKDGTTLEVKSKGHSVLTCPNFYDCSVSASIRSSAPTTMSSSASTAENYGTAMGSTTPTHARHGSVGWP